MSPGLLFLLLMSTRFGPALSPVQISDLWPSGATPGMSFLCGSHRSGPYVPATGFMSWIQSPFLLGHTTPTAPGSWSLNLERKDIAFQHQLLFLLSPPFPVPRAPTTGTCAAGPLCLAGCWLSEGLLTLWSE